MLAMMARAALAPPVVIIIWVANIAAEDCGWTQQPPIRPTQGFRIMHGLAVGHRMMGVCGTQTTGGIRHGLGQHTGNPHGMLMETWNELRDTLVALIWMPSARALALNTRSTIDNNTTDFFIPTSLCMTIDTLSSVEAQPHHEARPPGQTVFEA
jgi:hypothetical protein